MVSALLKFTPTTLDKSRPFHGRYYGASSRKRSGVFKRLHVLVNDRGRRPCLETTFGGQKLQPFIHDGVIAIQPRRGQLTRFHIFVKNHCHLPRNRIIARWGVGQGWKGDIVIMRKGVVHEFVGLRSRDARLADFAVRKFVSRVSQGPKFKFPKFMVFGKA